MALGNINQLLLRNIDQFTAKSPLFVNIDADGFIEQYLSENPESVVDCYYTNFAQHTATKKLTSARCTSHFCAHYQTTKKHDLIIISFPKSKAEFSFTLAMLAAVATDDALIIIVGENKGGIKSAGKLAKNYLTYFNKVDAARHCLLYTGKFQSEVAAFHLDEHYIHYTLEVKNKAIKVAALPGVFSQKSLDVGTRILLDNLPEKIQGNVLDFGCGAGVIAVSVGTLFPEATLSLLDVSALALASAKRTLALNNLTGNFIASDSLSMLSGKYDVVISNPPFHQGIKTHYAATEQFLMGIKQHLVSKGTVTIVANSFLKYPPIMEKSIGKTTTLCQSSGFSIYQCQLTALKNNK